MQQVYVDKIKTKKLLLLLFVRLSRSLHFGKFACLMITGCVGCTADAEHQRQQQRHIYVVYGPTHDRYAWFAMPAMFRASATEVQWLLISSHDSGGPGDGNGTFASQTLTHLLIRGFMQSTWVGIGLGLLFFCLQHPLKVSGTSLTIHNKVTTNW